MKRKYEGAEQLHIEIETPVRVRDVKGYVQMVRKQREQEEKKTVVPVVSHKKPASYIGVEKYGKKRDEMMFDFVKLTLPAKMRIIPERVAFSGDERSFGRVCNLFVKHPSVAGAGEVRYSFTKTTCYYQDWFGNEIDYSTAWQDYCEKRERDSEQTSL